MVAVKPMTDCVSLIYLIDDLISVLFSRSSEDRQFKVIC